jgi:hypothetical protein
MFTMKDSASLRACWIRCGLSLATGWRCCATHAPSGRVTAAVCASKPPATWGADHHVVVSQQQAADPRPQIHPRLISHVTKG